jgi:hypothetical protein
MGMSVVIHWHGLILMDYCQVVLIVTCQMVVQLLELSRLVLLPRFKHLMNPLGVNQQSRIGLVGLNQLKIELKILKPNRNGKTIKTDIEYCLPLGLILVSY